MLFIIAMDILHRMIQKASRDGVLGPTEPQAVKFQCSMYADDAIIFIRPTTQEARAIKEIP
jgi:ABC-type branched-subunit amino acid transport system substrate-binding protein